jgi:hypothetical protein
MTPRPRRIGSWPFPQERFDGVISRHANPVLRNVPRIYGYSISSAKSVNPCASTISLRLVTDSLAAEEALSRFSDIPTALIPSSRIPQSHDTLRALTVFRCFPPVDTCLAVRPNMPVTRSSSQSTSHPLARIIDLRSNFSRAAFKTVATKSPLAQDALINLQKDSVRIPPSRSEKSSRSESSRKIFLRSIPLKMIRCSAPKASMRSFRGMLTRHRIIQIL